MYIYVYLYIDDCSPFFRLFHFTSLPRVLPNPAAKPLPETLHVLRVRLRFQGLQQRILCAAQVGLRHGEALQGGAGRVLEKRPKSGQKNGETLEISLFKHVKTHIYGVFRSDLCVIHCEHVKQIMWLKSQKL